MGRALAPWIGVPARPPATSTSPRQSHSSSSIGNPAAHKVQWFLPCICHLKADGLETKWSLG